MVTVTLTALCLWLLLVLFPTFPSISAASELSLGKALSLIRVIITHFDDYPPALLREEKSVTSMNLRVYVAGFGP